MSPTIITLDLDQRAIAIAAIEHSLAFAVPGPGYSPSERDFLTKLAGTFRQPDQHVIALESSTVRDLRAAVCTFEPVGTASERADQALRFAQLSSELLELVA